MRDRGTVIISTVVTCLVRSTFIQRLIYVSRYRVVQVPNKTRIRATPVAVVCDAQIQYEVDRTHNVRQINHQLDVSTPLTPAPVHLLCLYLGACAKRSASCSTAKSTPSPV